jgi:putative transposase
MGAYRVSIGTKFRWRDHDYVISDVLPKIEGVQSRRINIVDLATGEVDTVEEQTLRTALWAGQLAFIRPERKPRKSQGGTATDTEKPPQPQAKVQYQYATLDDAPPHLAAIARARQWILDPLADLPPKERTLDAVKARLATVKAELSALSPDDWRRKAVKRAPGKSAAYEWLRWYVDAERDPRVLLPSTTRCGAPGVSRLDPVVEAIVHAVIRELYMVQERRSIDGVHHEAVLRIKEANNERDDTDDKLKQPSRATVARRIDDLDVRQMFAVKHGKRAADRKFRQYDERERPEYPGQEAECDSTPTDLIVIDDADDLPLGRLTLYYILDRCTAYPLGYALTWDEASYMSVAQALLHAIMPKTGARRRYGLAHDWQAFGIPALLVVDNGPEYWSTDFLSAAQDLPMAVRFSPVASPEFKGGVERRLGATATMLLHELPGTVFSNPQQRGKYASHAKAAIYLSEIDKLLHLYIVDEYAELFHSGINGIPARQWERRTAGPDWNPRLPESVDSLRTILGRTDERVVQHYGIEINSVTYNSGDLGALRADLRGKQTRIKWDPGDLGAVNVFDPFSSQIEGRDVYIRVPAAPIYAEYATGLSLWKHQHILRLARTFADKPDIAAVARAKRQMREIVEHGHDRRKMANRKIVARHRYGGQATANIDFSAHTGDNSAAEAAATDTPPLFLPPAPLWLPERAGIDAPLPAEPLTNSTDSADGQLVSSTKITPGTSTTTSKPQPRSALLPDDTELGDDWGVEY